MFPPERIVCLTEETVETLYLLGEQRRIAGVSGYAVRPPQVRREKPRVSAFISADFEKIIALEPDLVLTFSDLQAEIAAEFAIALAEGEEVPQDKVTEELDNGAGKVPSVALKPVAVTKGNVKSTVIADEFVTAQELCTSAYAQACKEAGISG